MLMVERLSAKELQALAVYEMATALWEIVEDVSEQRRLLKGAHTILADAKKAVLLAPTADQKNHAKARVIDANLVLQHIKDRVSLLKSQGSFLQSLLGAERIA
jgi:hypothetical protein